MLHWIQYIKGYVSIKVWGYSTERFLNLCGNHDILVWDIENHGDYYTMKVSVKGFFSLKTLLKKTGTRASVLERYGLPFFVPRIKRRKIFVIGLVVCLLFWMLTTRFIWDIKITGNYSLTEDILMDYLNNQNVHTAMKKSDLQIEELERNLREEYDIITWASLKVDGTTLIIQIRENEMPEYDTAVGNEQDSVLPDDDMRSGKDIVAAKDGTIVYMITRKGVPQVALGDSVEKGQLLVSGAVPVYNEDTTVRRYQYYEADADIMLSYDKSIKVEKETAYEDKVYSGNEKKILLLGIKDREWNLSFGKIKYEDYDVSGEKKQVQLLDHLFLPAYYGMKYAKEYTLVEKKHTEEEMQQIMEEEWSKILQTLEEKGVEITEKNGTIRKNEDKWVLNVRMNLVEPAVKKVSSTTQQIPITESEEETELSNE
ncbi:MAG: sporulation protein YqfD [Lachnospiraceae bacterium]|nr:sporulation protein YqfD [Lachnospiraceae bacterium]